jgi:hypothetical protein
MSTIAGGYAANVAGPIGSSNGKLGSGVKHLGGGSTAGPSHRLRDVEAKLEELAVPCAGRPTTGSLCSSAG